MKVLHNTMKSRHIQNSANCAAFSSVLNQKTLGVFCTPIYIIMLIIHTVRLIYNNVTHEFCLMASNLHCNGCVTSLPSIKSPSANYG